MNSSPDIKHRSAALNHLLLSRLRLRHLTLLSLIGQHRRISRVADVLGMGQPAITKALKDVEDIFGTVLFERATAGLKPTEAGEAVLQYAEVALADLSMTSQRLAAISAGLHGRIRLGIIPHAPELLLAAAMERLAAESPRISIVVREGSTAELVSALRSHELDCAIGRSLQQNNSAEIIQEPIFEQTPGLLVTPPVFDRIAKRPLDWQLLAELDWILQPPSTPMRQIVDTIFSSAGVPPPLPVVETISMRAIENALRFLPNGITVLARDQGERLVATGTCRLLPYDLDWTLPPICLLLQRSTSRQPMVEALADVIRGAGRELALARRIRHSANY